MLSLWVCSRLLFTWQSKTKGSVQLCTIGPIEFFLKLRILLFYRFINVSVTLEITLTAFNIEPYNFWVLRYLDLILNWNIAIQISVWHFFTFNLSKFSVLGWLSNFLTICFSLFIGVRVTLFILAKLLPMGSPVFSTKLKSFLISLVMSSSSLSSPSSLMWPPLSWQCGE